VIQKINFSYTIRSLGKVAALIVDRHRRSLPKRLRTSPFSTKIYVAISKLKCYSTRDVYLFIEFYFTPVLLNILLHLVGTINLLLYMMN